MKARVEGQHMQPPWKILFFVSVIAGVLFLLLSGNSRLRSRNSLPSDLPAAGHSGVDIGNGQTFSSAIKGGFIEAGTETLLFWTDKGPGYTTQQWYTFDAIGDSVDIRVYVDGEKKPSIEFNLFLGHGIGCSALEERNHTPWSTEFISHLADYHSALSNNYRIPFGKSLRITATTPRFATTNAFWYLIHGVYNAPLVIEGYRLPSSARLRLHRQLEKVVKPLDFLTMADVQGAGWLFQVTMSARSPNLGFLEGCHRAEIDGQQTQFFSSGTEDLFLGAFYFDRGVFHSDNTGLTCFRKPPFRNYWKMTADDLEKAYKKRFGTDYPGTHVSAYKFFVKDPVIFQKSLIFRWRCGESETDEQRCPRSAQRNDDGLKDSWPKADTTTITTYSWVYHF